MTAQPGMLASAAGDLQSIGSAMAAGNMAAAAPTTGVVPAATDEVSARYAALLDRIDAGWSRDGQTPGDRTGKSSVAGKVA